MALLICRGHFGVCEEALQRSDPNFQQQLGAVAAQNNRQFPEPVHRERDQEGQCRRTRATELAAGADLPLLLDLELDGNRGFGEQGQAGQIP